MLTNLLPSAFDRTDAEPLLFFDEAFPDSRFRDAPQEREAAPAALEAPRPSRPVPELHVAASDLALEASAQALLEIGEAAANALGPIAENGTPGLGAAPVGRTFVQGVDALLSSWKWNGSVVTYSYPDAINDYQPGYPSDHFKGFQGIGAHQYYAIHWALDTATHHPGYLGHAGFSVEGFTNLAIDFAGAGHGGGTMRFANNTNSNTAYAFYPSSAYTGGDVWFGKSGRAPVTGNYDNLTVLHEIGHALGLKHGHETDVYGALPFDLDSMEYTVMTYRSHVGSPLGGYSNEDWGYAQSFMMLDIAALQHMYGADFTTNSGSTVYSWDPTNGRTYVNGALATNPGGNRIFQTIWDGGGIDTYDLSNYTTDLEISLAPGYHSTFSRAQLADLNMFNSGGIARGNVFNALQYKGDARSLIENAFGGSGRDKLIGNAADNELRGNAGDDDLYGFGGHDRLYGGAGNDRLDGGNGPEADYMVGGAGDDMYFVDNAYDVTLEEDVSAGGGVDTVFSYIEWVLGAGLENLTLLGGPKGTGNALANVIQGTAGANELLGLGGNDVLRGHGGADLLVGGAGSDQLVGGAAADVLRGQAGADRLVGGAQADVLIGGAGADRFVFESVSDSTRSARDVCRAGDGAIAFEGAGVAGGDLIDLSAIDANTTVRGDQAFIFGGTGIGRVSVVNSGTNSLVRCNVDTSAAFEFELLIEDGGILASAYRALDFVL